MGRLHDKCNQLLLLYLPHARLRLRLRINKITMYSITITLKVIKIAIEITFVLKHSQKENKTNLRGFR